MNRIIIITVSFLLTACVPLPAKHEALNQPMSWQARRAQLIGVKQWQLNGALLIKTKEQGQAIHLVWQQQWPRYRYQINLFGPLGLGHILLTSNVEGVDIYENNKHYHSQNIEDLMRQSLGWHLPISNLYFWIRGVPAPHLKNNITFDVYHHIVYLQQQGWHIAYQQYTTADGIDLPCIIILRRNKLNIKFIINQWKFK